MKKNLLQEATDLTLKRKVVISGKKSDGQDFERTGWIQEVKKNLQGEFYITFLDDLRKLPRNFSIKNLIDIKEF
jgi:hypothetical protein